MATMTKAVKGKDTGKAVESHATRLFAELMRAFTECSDDVQGVVLEMVEIVNDPDADFEDVEMALATIHEALFPAHHNGKLGADLDEVEYAECNGGPQELQEAIEELNSEEAVFADRVQKLMEVRNMTQTDLATAIGVGQPAVSMMLSRATRPQKRTVAKIASVFGVSEKSLWPTV